MLMKRIENFLDNPDSFKRIEIPKAPPGSPLDQIINALKLMFISLVFSKHPINYSRKSSKIYDDFIYGSMIFNFCFYKIGIDLVIID